MTSTTSYWVRVSNASGTRSSTAALVSVLSAELVEPATPLQLSTSFGGAVRVAVIARGQNLKYEWFRGTMGNTSSPLPANASSGSQAMLSAPEGGASQPSSYSYWVRLTPRTDSGVAGTPRDYAVATVTKCPSFSLSEPPSTQYVTRLTSTGAQRVVPLSVTASYANPVVFEWYRGTYPDTTRPILNNITYQGQTSTYHYPVTGSGAFWVSVRDAANSCIHNFTNTFYVICTDCPSADAESPACIAPDVSTPSTSSASYAQYAGNSAWVSANASGSSLTYQWHRGQSGDTSQPIGYAHSPTYAFTAAASDAYWLRVSNPCGSINSLAVMHSVHPTITTQPAANPAVPMYGKAKLKVVAAGNEKSYQWYRGASGNVADPISGATGDEYETPPLTAQAQYWVKVSSGINGFAWSNTSTVGICQGPAVGFSSQPGWGGCSTLYAPASPEWAGNVYYVWYRGTPGNPSASTVVNESASNYMSVCPTTATTYWVRAWTADRTCYSDTGGVTVYPQ